MNTIEIPLRQIVDLAYAPYNLAERLRGEEGLMSTSRLNTLDDSFRLVATTANLGIRDWITSCFPSNDYSTFSGFRSIILDHRELPYRVVASAGTYKIADVVNDIMFLCHFRTRQEQTLERFVRRHFVAKPHIFIGHSLGGYLSICGATHFRGNFVTINPGYARHLDVGIARGLHLLSEEDMIAGVIRKRLPRSRFVVPGSGHTHSPEFLDVDGHVSICIDLLRDPKVVIPG